MSDSTNELLRQIWLGEDSTLELKVLECKDGKITGPHRNGMADELAAMANTTSGTFLLGVDDKTKEIVGIPQVELDAAETWVRSICNDLITPPLFCSIRKLAVGDKTLIRIDVPRSLYVHQSPNGYFHRIGSSKRQMSPEILARLFQQRSQTRLIRFDEQAVPNAPVEYLQKNLWQKFRTPLSPQDDTEFLLKLKLLTENEDGSRSPTVSAVLMACERPQEYLPGAFIQAVFYRATERNAAYQLDAKDIVGPLDVQIAEAYKFVEKNMNVFAVKTPARHDIPQYSMAAVFEALVNAVAHRDYSIYGSKIRLQMFVDRLELFSPGSIPNTMTIDSLPLRQSARNELLTSLLARCPATFGEQAGHRGLLMDKRGEGVPIILSESEKLSGRRPVYQLIDDAELMLTIYPAMPGGVQL